METAIDQQKVLNPWDQQPWEPDIWYARFQEYLTLPKSERSINEYYRHSKGDNGVKLPGSVAVECAKYKWVERGEAYDKHRATLTLRTQEAATDRMKNATENAMAVLSEAMNEALLSGKPSKDWPENVRVSLSILESFSGKGGGINSLLNAYQTFFGTKKHVTSDVKLFEIPIMLDEQPPIEIQAVELTQQDI